MKTQFSKTELKLCARVVIRAGYCELQNLLHGCEPFAYNRGLYGWNWDAYDIGGGVTVCTGYRSLTGQRVQCADLEERARNIRKTVYNWDEQLKQLAALRAELVERATK